MAKGTGCRLAVCFHAAQLPRSTAAPNCTPPQLLFTCGNTTIANRPLILPKHRPAISPVQESRRNALGSQPNTAPGSQATGAGGSQGAAGEEVESVAALPLEAAAEELARWAGRRAYLVVAGLLAGGLEGDAHTEPWGFAKAFATGVGTAWPFPFPAGCCPGVLHLAPSSPFYHS